MFLYATYTPVKLNQRIEVIHISSICYVICKPMQSKSEGPYLQSFKNLKTVKVLGVCLLLNP